MASHPVDVHRWRGSRPRLGFWGRVFLHLGPALAAPYGLPLRDWTGLLVSDWDGRGLPPAAAARMERFRVDGVRTSLLDVSGAVSTSGVGLPPIGEVMGCIVLHLGWQGFGGCGNYGNYGGFGNSANWATPTVTSGQQQRYGGYRPYVDAMYAGYNTAIGRLVTEAQTMGAHGIVGVRLSVNHHGQGNREFVALGTAVRAESRTRLTRPFVTDLGGADVAKLMHAGWIPAAIAVGISVAVRHDDYTTRAQASSWGQNVEVAGYTELVQHVRSDARARFHEHASSSGADVAIISSMSLDINEIEPSEGHRDHVAESVVIGGTLVRFAHNTKVPSGALTIIPL
jgi:uncharacterized protein YbjQ (UPF0145 family)